MTEHDQLDKTEAQKIMGPTVEEVSNGLNEILSDNPLGLTEDGVEKILLQDVTRFPLITEAFTRQRMQTHPGFRDLITAKGWEQQRNANSCQNDSNPTQLP